MADQMYAWSNFPVEWNEHGQVTKTVKVGDSVSQSDFKDMSDEDWQTLIDTGAVRPDPYPDIPRDVAPAEWYQDHPEDHPDAEVQEELEADIEASVRQADAEAAKQAKEAAKPAATGNKA